MFDPVKKWAVNELNNAIANTKSTALLNTLQTIWNGIKDL